MQIWIHDNKMKKITALNNDVPDMLSYTNSTWHSYLDQATSTFDFTIPKFSNGELHEDLKLINDECFVSFYVNGSYQVFYIATLQEDDFNIQLTCNNTNLEYALEYADPFSSDSAQTIEWYLNKMYFLSYAAVEIGLNEISDRKRTLTFDSQETKMNRLQSLMSKFEAEFEFKVELNRDGTYKRIAINIYQKDHIGTDRKDVVLYYSNGLKGVQVNSDKTQMFTSGIFTGKDGLNLADVEISEKNSDGIEEFYSRKGDVYLRAPLAMQRYPSTMRVEGQDNWINKNFQTEYENVNDLKAYALRTLKQYAYPLMTYTASVQSGFVSQYTDLKLGDTIRIIDNNFVGGLALEARVSEMIISFDNPANNSFVFTNYRKIDNKPSAALQTRIEQTVESKLPYRIELATTGGVAFKNNEGETIVKPSLYKGNLPYTKDVSWHWALGGVVTVGTQYRIQARDITDSEVLTVAAYVGNLEVATTEITLTNVNDGVGVESIDRYFTSSDQSDGVTIEGAEWSDKPPAPTEDGKYLWAYDEIIYTDGTVTTTKPAAVGANFDVDAFRAEIAEDLKDVPNREEFENKISEEIANSKAEIETQIETAKTQAESNAKEYADTINQETAKVAELANAAADEIKADLVNVKNNLTSTSTVANNAQAAADAAKQELAEVNTKVDNAKEELTQAKQDLTEVANELSTAKQDLADSVTAVNTKVDSAKAELTQAKQDLVSQAQQLQTQANTQTELTKRVTTVETTANGTKTTVNELTKTVAQNGKDITSVTNRTKTVEDDLANTKTTLTQVQTTANSTSQKTATLESGLDGLTSKFNNLSVGGANLFKGSRDFSGSNWINNHNGVYAEDYKGVKIFKTQAMWLGRSQYFEVKTGEEYVFSAYVKSSTKTDGITFFLSHESKQPMTSGLVSFASNNNQDNIGVGLTNKYQRIVIKIKITQDGWMMPRLERTNENAYLFFGGYKLEHGNVATDYSPNDADIEQKIAEYKQNADQNYASLQTTVQNLDGTVQQNKATAEQTAQGFKTRIESLETYKDGETTRANQYFELAKTETARQLTAERTAIAKDYVAKSTYTSDVTGIRNDLSATTTTANTTKTNLANYQASNDRAVANLQSNIQTANGDISSLKTKVEAVPGQITSAVSAVESKIPTSAGGRNLAQGTSKDWSKPFTGFSGIQNTCPSLYRVTTDGLVVGDTIKTRIVLKYTDIRPASGKTAEIWLQGAGNVTGWNSGPYPSGGGGRRSISGSGEIIFELTDKINANHLKNAYWNLAFRTDWIASGSLQWRLAKVERGMFFTDWSPAPEDTVSQISNLSSQIKQTADGMTLLATKTELNTAKSDLQSGINTATNKANAAQNTANSAQNKANSNAQTISTHTTQISALNTGLQAKVSQTEFNTLSGRVTTAENNITAKANELSSKITSVEGKIPTSVGGRNLWIQSKVTGNFVEETLPDNHITGQKKCYRLSNNQEIKFNIEPDFSSRLYRKVTFSAWVKYENVVQGGNNWNEFNCFKHQLYRKNSSTGATTNTDHLTLEGFTGTSDWKRITYTYDYAANKSYDQLKTSIRFNLENVRSGTAWVTGVKIEIGSIPSDYSPAPEVTDTQISSLSSELKQTKDGITLLATKTELNNAKTELQSGISTATNKANNNAQTISTHTNQISALNTGLQAKVSQSDFNTLSGRVTSAENNITAKANELSSKITSVEGKIPTSIDTVNLIKGTGSAFAMGGGITNTTWNETKKQTILDFSVPGVNLANSPEIRPQEKKFFDFKPIKGTTYTQSIMIDTDATFNPNGQALCTWFTSSGGHNQQKAYIKKVGVQSYQVWSTYTWNLENTALRAFDWWDLHKVLGFRNSGTYLAFYKPKLTAGNLPSDWSPAPEDTISQISSLSSEFKQTTDAIKASVTSLDKSTVKSSSLTINSDGIVMKAGKSTTDVANAIGSYFSVNQNAINLFSDKINVKGNMIVNGAITSDKIASKSINTAHLNGKIITADVIATNAVTADAIKAGAVTTDKMSANSINGDRITAGTLDAAKIKAGSITASQIASGTITSAQIKTGTISAANIAAGAITSDKIASNSISSDKIVASGITANVIKGGVLTALNNAMQVNLDDSNITFSNNASVIFTSSDNALKRVIANKPSQFIKMYDEVFVSEIGELPNSTLTVIGSNSDRTESSDSSGFGGLRIWNGRSSTATTSFAELVGNRVAIYGNKNRSPWLFDMTGTTSYLIPQNSNGIKHSLGRSDRPFYSVYADNMYIQGERVAMMLKDIALHIGYGGNNGWVGRIQ